MEEVCGMTVALSSGMRTTRSFRFLLLTALLLVSGRAAQAATVTLAWDADTTGSVNGYVLYWGTQSGQLTQSVTLGNVTSATVSPTVNESMIYFAVRSFNSAGMSAMSQEVVAWIGTVSRTPSLMRPGDYDGDGKADPMVYRSTNGQWFAAKSATNGLLSASWGAPAYGDVPVPADYDGDGTTDIAVYRNTSGGWFLHQSQAGDASVNWGAPSYGDLPVPDDYDGDGKADIGVFRRRTGEWLVRRSTDGSLLKTAWGAAGDDDAPVPGDYDGDGKADIAVYRRTTGQWFVRFAAGNTAAWSWGSPLFGDIPVPADYDGDGKLDVGVFRQANGTWVVNHSSTNQAQTLLWGSPANGDIPVPADFDGDGKADIAVFRATTGNWYVARSTGGSTSFTWGAPAYGDNLGGYREVTVVPYR
jgi:hypothetical protein